jgi:hypothetical protein
MVRLGIRIRRSDIEKARRDLSKLTTKVITDKNGHRRTVYVRLGLPVNGNLKAGKDGKVESGLVETDHEKGLTDRELKKECFLYARENFQGKSFNNAETGRNILVSRDGLDEWYNKTKSRDQALSIKRIDKLLENGKKIDQSGDDYKRQYVEGFIYFSTSCMVNGRDYNAVITVKQTKGNPDKFYHYYLQDIKIEPHSGYGTSSENPI